MKKNIFKKFNSALVSGSLMLTSIVPQCSVLAMNEKDDNDNSNNESNKSFNEENEELKIHYQSQSGAGWDYDGNSETLTIKNDDAMINYDSDIAAINHRPWEQICHGIKKLVIEKNVTKIGDAAFSEFYNLSEVIFESESQVKTIGKSAFNECLKLKNITIPNNVEFIDEFAFCNCFSLANVIFEKESKIKNIKKCAFLDCHELSNIIIDTNNNIEVANDAFESCNNLNNEIKERFLKLYRPSKKSHQQQQAYKKGQNKLKKFLTFGIFLSGLYIAYKFFTNSIYLLF